jgi:hypothetical protein
MKCEKILIKTEQKSKNKLRPNSRITLPQSMEKGPNKFFFRAARNDLYILPPTRFFIQKFKYELRRPFFEKGFKNILPFFIIIMEYIQ